MSLRRLNCAWSFTKTFQCRQKLAVITYAVGLYFLTTFIFAWFVKTKNYMLMECLMFHTWIICIFNILKCLQTVFNNSYNISTFLPVACKSRVLLTSWCEIFKLIGAFRTKLHILLHWLCWYLDIVCILLDLVVVYFHWYFSNTDPVHILSVYILKCFTFFETVVNGICKF